MDRVVTFETLPSQRISVCFRKVSETVLMDCLARRFGLYNVELDEAGYHFVKGNQVKDSGVSGAGVLSGMVRIEVLENDAVLVDVEDCRFSSVLEKLFGLA